jgi:ribosomal protein S18 acetylase RimI-like enzyme
MSPFAYASLERRDGPTLTRGGPITGVAGWKDMNVRHVYVDPPQGRQGIGTKLVRHVERDFRERTRASEIRAGVAVHAKDFYASNGYEVVTRAKAWDCSDYLQMVERF